MAGRLRASPLLATGALFVGFPGLDAPARTRAAWQAAVTPFVGLAAALGVLTGPSAPLAVAAMALVGAMAGYCFAVSLRLSIAGLSAALSLLISQGLQIPVSHAPEALLFTSLGGLLQAAFSLCVYAARDREEEDGATGWNTRAALQALSANLTLRSTSARHALRFGAALAAGVAAYWLLGMHEHGFWVPLTILFVLRPEEDETFHRLILRAGRHRGWAGHRHGAVLLAQRRRRRPRHRPDRRHRVRLRPAHGPIRVIHDCDHRLRGAAGRHAG